MNAFERRVRELVAQQPEEFALDWVKTKFKGAHYRAASQFLRGLSATGELRPLRPGWVVRTALFNDGTEPAPAVTAARRFWNQTEQHYAIFRQSLGDLRVSEIDGAAPAAHAKARL